MHEHVRERVEDASLTVTPLSLVMRLERTFLSAEALGGLVVNLLEQVLGELQAAVFESPVQFLEGVDVVDEFDLGLRGPIEFAAGRALRFENAEAVALD